MADVDFRILKPATNTPKMPEYAGFLIPCSVLKFTNDNKGNRKKIVIERLDFASGKLIQHDAFAYHKTVRLFKELAMALPRDTWCEVVKNPTTGGLEFFVFGWYDVGLLNLLTGEDMSLTDDELNRKFHENYTDLNEWVSAR